MAITARTPTTANTGTGTATTLTPGYPTSTAAGDVVLGVFNISAGATITGTATGPSNNVQVSQQQSTSNNAQLDLWQGSPTSADLATAASFTASAARACTAAVAAFSGATYESTTDGTQTAGTTAPIPTVTPSKDNSLLVLIVCANSGATNGLVTPTATSGWTNIAHTVTTNSGIRICTDVFTQQLGSGTAGTSQGGGTIGSTQGNTNRYMSSVVVLAPASTSTPASAAGGISAGGTATGAAAAAASGSVTTGGSATASARAAAVGSVSLSGVATASANGAAAGTLVVGGTATPASTAVNASATGTLIFGGVATATVKVAGPLPPVDWSTLTAVQQQLIATTTAQQVSYGCELLNADLSVNQDLSGYLDQSTGDVQWTADATVHRDCQVTLTTELAWGVALLRVFMLKTDIPSGLTARRNLGVFCLTTPERDLGTLIRDVNGAPTLSYDVTGQDRLYLLTRPIGYSYQVNAGAGVLSAIQAVFAAAGVPAGTFLIDSSAAASTVPADMPYPLIASSSDSTPAAYTQPQDLASSSSSSDSKTWLDVLNDLLGLIGYKALWCDENGQYRCSPWADPATLPPSFTFDADDVYRSPVAQDRKITKDLWSIPNQWTGIWQNMPGGAAPTTTNGGVYTVNNVSNGPSSQTARQIIWSTTDEYSAASQADFQNQVNARAASDQRVTTTFAVNTAPYPGVGHEDVYGYSDSQVGSGVAKVRCTSWEAPLDGSDFTFSWESIT